MLPFAPINLSRIPGQKLTSPQDSEDIAIGCDRTPANLAATRLYLVPIASDTAWGLLSFHLTHFTLNPIVVRSWRPKAR